MTSKNPVEIKKLIDKLKVKPVSAIINWMVENMPLSDLMECIRTINPKLEENLASSAKASSSVQNITGGISKMTLGAGIPVNAVNAVVAYSMKNYESDERKKIDFIERTRDLNVVPIGFIPANLSKYKELEFVYITDKSQIENYNSDDGANIRIVESDTFTGIEMKITGKSGVWNPINNKLPAKTITLKILMQYFRGFLELYFTGYKTYHIEDEYKLYDKPVSDTKYKKKVYIDTDRFLIPYGVGNAWTYSKDESKYGVYQIYSFIFMDKNINNLDSKNPFVIIYNKLKGTNSILLAYDVNSKEGKPYYVRTYNYVTGLSAIFWRSENDINNGVETTDPRTKKKVLLSLTEPISKITNYGPPLNLKKINEGFLVDNVPFYMRISNIHITEDEKYKWGNVITQIPNLNLRTYQIGPYDFSLYIELLGGAEGSDIGAGPSGGIKSRFGAIQRMAARKNIYITGVKFGNTTNLYHAYMFDHNNEASWRHNRDSKTFTGEWVDEKELSRLLDSPDTNKKPTIKGLTQFGMFKNVFVPMEVHRQMDVHLPPMNPMSFGYIQKARALTPNKFKSSSFGKMSSNWDGQLYPLGQNAYISGPHQGVSSNFSQQFSEEHGLWNPVLKPVIQKPLMGQFQFGANFGAKRSHCFGSSNFGKSSFGKSGFGKPNDWETNGIINSYTGGRMSGISNSMYGYNGTQSVYGGNTGVSGYPALSRQTMGLVPFRMRK